jgi:hypothetical protein
LAKLSRQMGVRMGIRVHVFSRSRRRVKYTR